MNKRKALLGTVAAFLAMGAGNVAMAGTNYPTQLSMGYSGASGGVTITVGVGASGGTRPPPSHTQDHRPTSHTQDHR